MATDWIKMRTNLWDDPRVAAIVDATDSSEREVIGALYWLWATADEHTSDGRLAGMSLRQLDRKTGLAGFGAALVGIGWAAESNGGVRVERFDDHNGESTKNRICVAKRVTEHRYRKRTPVTDVVTNQEQVAYQEQEQEQEQEEAIKQNQKHVQPAAAQGVPDSLTADIPKPAAPAEPPAPEKPKRKPKPQATADRFAEWWAAYPVKKGKADALRHWKTHALDPMADALIAHVRRMEREDDEWRRGFIPHGSTYINGKRWEDDPKKDKPATAVTAPAPENFGAKAALAPSESKLEHSISWARQQYQRGDFGEGEQALSRLNAEILAAKKRHGGGHG